MVGNYYGWYYAPYKAIDYKSSDGAGYQSGSDIQYPFPDIHVKYGDVLVFTRQYSFPPDDLYLVPQQIYESCNFSHPYNITNTSSLRLAGSNEIYCDPGTAESASGCQYEFTIKDWSNLDVSHNNDILYNTLIKADTLYFTSSYKWNANASTAWRSCQGGLKLKVHIEQDPDPPTNMTYSPGGYYGWYHRTSYPDLYPLMDLHVNIGDEIFFTSRVATSEDLWLVPYQVYTTCNFTNETYQEQLATASFLRGGYYTRNESCTPGVNGCSQNGWIINSYPYNAKGGYSFIVQQWHVEQWGNPLYFASGRDWDRWDAMNYHGCLNGIKLRVFVEGKCTQRAPLNRSNNANTTHSPGGYYGWYYRSTEPENYPFQDLHVSVGDTINFTSRAATSEDLWLVPYQVYETCNFTNETNQIQLAVSLFLRGGYYTRNESCTINVDDGCDKGWVINTYPYNELGGYPFLVQDWYVEQWGNPLYFASGRDWDRWDVMSYHGCLNGIKLRVFVEGICLSRASIIDDENNENNGNEHSTTSTTHTTLSSETENESGVRHVNRTQCNIFVWCLLFIFIAPICN